MAQKRRPSLIAVLTICMMLLAAAASVGAVHIYADTENRADVDPGEMQAAQKPDEVGAFEVTSYKYRAKVRKDHSYYVVEKIGVNIPDDLASIQFAIPSGNFRISNIKVEDAAYASKTASEASTVSIVDPDKLTKGSHVYTIKYLIQEYHDKDPAKDMFYFNVLLPEWKQPIGKVDIKVTFPEDFPWDDMHCYSGQFGVQDSNNRISFRPDPDAGIVTITGDRIPENFGITLKDQLPDGYWEGALNGLWAFNASLIALLGAAVILMVLWLIGGRDPKVSKDPVTKPIEGLSPVDLGYAFRGRVQIGDVLRLLISFGQKGYLRISEYEPKRYRLYKEEEPAGEERMYRSAWGILFEDIYKGRAVDMAELGPRLERILSSIEDDVAAGFTTNDSLAFTPVSRAFRAAGSAILGIALGLANAFSYIYDYQSINYIESILIALAAAAASMVLCRAVDGVDSVSRTSGRMAIAGAAFLLALPVIYTAVRTYSNTGIALLPAAVIVSAGVSAFLIIIMRARGRQNAELVGKLRQIRNFIYHPTPKELLANHLADPNYYYEMLTYALALGAEEAWAISFLTLDVPEPDWYSDDIEGHAFSNLREQATTIDYARDLRSFIRTIENAFSDMERRRIRKK